MYLLVIPTSHTLDTEPLIYFCSEEFHAQIVLGSLVEVPIRTSMTYAVVSALDVEISGNLDATSIRSIVRVVCSTPLLSQDTLLVIQEISDLYLVPIHKVLSLFLPKSTLTSIEKRNFEMLESPKIDGKDKTDYLNTGIPKDREPIRTIQFFHTTRVTPLIIENYLSPDTIVILPDDILLRSCENYFSQQKKDYSFTYGDTTITRKIRSWVDVKNHKFSICFGTRRLLYYNLSGYKKILYIEDAFAPEYFQHPLRYKHIDILNALSRYSILDIAILTSIPAIETLSKLRHFSIQNITGN